MADIFAYSSNFNHCTYSLSLTRSGSTVTLTAQGTIYGNGESADNGNDLYAHVLYNVVPANTSGASTYVTNYGSRSPLGNGIKVVSKPLNKTSIPEKGVGFKVSWSWTNNNAVTLNNCALFLSKSATDASAVGNNAYAFVGKKYSGISLAKLRYYTETLSVKAGYSACGAPTSVSVSGQKLANYAKPDDTITVKWSGASGGNSNAITGYYVYYRITSNGAAPGTSSGTYTGYAWVSTTATYGSTTFSFKNATRGYKIVAGVITYGQLGSSWLSGMATGGGCSINRLPGAPTITVSSSHKNNIVPYDGGALTYTLKSVGSDSDSGLPLTCWYANNTDHKGEGKIESTRSLTVTRSTPKWYFWTWDGLEYSSGYTAPTITFNDKPTISSATMEVTGATRTYNKNGTNVEYKLPVVSLNSSASKGSYGNDLTYKWELFYIEGATSFNSNNSNQKPAGTISSASSATSVKLASKLPLNCAYGVKLTVSDGYDTAEKWTTVSGSPITPPVPSFSSVYNTNGMAYVNGSVHSDSITHFHDYVTISFSKDTGVKVNSIDMYLTNDSTTKVNISNAYSIVNGNYIVIGGLADKTDPRKLYSIDIILGHEAGTTTISKLRSNTDENKKDIKLKRDGLPYNTFDECILNPPGITQNINVFSNIDGGNTDVLTIGLNLFSEDYTNIDINPSSTTYNLQILLNGINISGYCDIESISEGSPNKQITISKTNFYNYLNLFGDVSGRTINPLNLNLNNENQITVTLNCKSVFGTWYNTFKEKALIMDCNYNVNSGFIIGSTTDSLLEVYLNNQEANTNDILYEKDKIKYKFKYRTYNNDKIEWKTYIYRSTTVVSSLQTITNWSDYPDSNRNILIISPSEFGSRDTTTHTFSGSVDVTYVVNEITNSNYIYFKITASRGGHNPIDFYIGTPTIQSQRLVPINPLVIRSALFSDNSFIWSHEAYKSGGGLISADNSSISGLIDGKFEFLVVRPKQSFSVLSPYIIRRPEQGETLPKLCPKYELVTDPTQPEDWVTHYYNYYTYNSDKDEINLLTSVLLYFPDTFYTKSEYFNDTYLFSINHQNLATEEDTIDIKLDSVPFPWEDVDSYFTTPNSYYNIRLVGTMNAGASSIVRAYKITYGQTYQIFNLEPTVSYRENLIGINVKPESVFDNVGATYDYRNNTVAIINMPNNTKKYMVLLGVNNSVLAHHVIDLSDGSIDEFIIDGGEW